MAEENELEQQLEKQKEAEKQLLETSRENLDKVFGDEPNPDESQEESTSEQSKEEQSDESTSEQKDEDKQTDTSDEKDEADKTDKTDDSEAGDKPKLTPAEIRAAKHLGWSEDEIKELEKVNPELAKKTCSKALESTNNLSKKFSELGKAKVKKPELEPEPKSQPKPEPKPNVIDFTALEKEYENDPIVGVLKQVVEQNQALANEVTTLKTSTTQSDDKVSQAQAQEDAAIAQQIDVFFARPDIVEYKDVYGEVPKDSKDWDDLTQGQIKKRWTVVEQANLILLGAKQQGMDMPLDEAFERAHLLVTEDVREQTIRNKIKKEAVKRSKGVSFEPSDSKKVTPTGPKTKEQIHQNAKAGLQKVFRS